MCVTGPLFDHDRLLFTPFATSKPSLSLIFILVRERSSDDNVARRVGGVIELLEAAFDFGRHKDRGPLEALVAVFLVHGRVVFLWVFAAFDEERDQKFQLRVGVAGVVNVGGRLE